MQVIYIDSLFCLSLLTDYLLCLTAGRICGLTLRRGRYLAAAFLGAAYAAAVFLPGLGFLSLPAGRLGCGICMGLIAFGKERRPFRCTGVLLAAAAAFGGALWAVSLAFGAGVPAHLPALSVPTLLLSFGILYALLSFLMRARRLLTERRRLQVCATLGGRTACFTALEDTGNTLCDPLTGRHVMIASPTALQPILGEHSLLFERLTPVELLEALAQLPALAGRVRLLPCTHVGGVGLLVVFRPDHLRVNGVQTNDLLIAVSPHAHGDGFDAIL